MAESKKEEVTEATLDAALTLDVSQIAQVLEAFAVTIQEVSRSLTVAPRHTLADYRTVTATRSLQELQARLDQGWDILHLDLCDEVRAQAGVGNRPSVMMWVPYAILGKKAALIASDQEAILADEERRMQETASPMGSPVGMTQEEPYDEHVPAGGPPREKVQRHVTQPVGSGFQPEGGLAGR